MRTNGFATSPFRKFVTSESSWVSSMLDAALARALMRRSLTSAASVLSDAGGA